MNFVKFLSIPFWKATVSKNTKAFMLQVTSSVKLKIGWIHSTGLHFLKTFLSGLSGLICLGGVYFRKRLFRDDEYYTNWLHEVHIFIKIKKHFLLNCVVDRLTLLLLIQAMNLFCRGAQKDLFPDVLQIRCSQNFRKFHKKTPALESY